MIRFTLTLFLLAFVVGCTSEDPHPEERDPIFKDLKAQAESHTKSVEEGKKKLEELYKALESAEANSLEQKNVRRDIASAKAALRENEQQARYLKIRMDRRAVVDKIEAREAKAKGEPWPNPTEYSDYQVNTRLRQTSLNWNKRVPKLQDRVVKPVTKESAGGEEAKGGGGSEH